MAKAVREGPSKKALITEAIEARIAYHKSNLTLEAYREIWNRARDAGVSREQLEEAWTKALEKRQRPAAVGGA